MKLGIHAYAWCSQWSNDTLDLIPKVKALGLDFIEIPLMRLDTFDAAAVKQKLLENDLEATTSTVLLEGFDITSEEEQERNKGIEYLKACVKATHDIGAAHLSGVIYSQHIKAPSARATEQDWRHSANGLREVARYAQSLNVTIAIEPVNRYETYLINTSEQGMQLLSEIGEPNVKIHLDTYHMNIEEKSFYEATRLVKDQLVHLHLCENDRGIPGTGLVNWDQLFQALGESGYTGYAALESFIDITDNMNTWVWRQLAPSGEVLVQEGIAFIRKMMIKHGLQ